jgi:hypothetical protein
LSARRHDGYDGRYKKKDHVGEEGDFPHYGHATVTNWEAAASRSTADAAA